MKRIWTFSLLVLFFAMVMVACGSGDNDEDTTAVGARSTVDRPDQIDGPQVHLIYALPSDGTDRHLDTDGTIARSFAAAQKWLHSQTDGRSFRFDTFEGEPDITFFALSRDDADMQTEGAFVRDEIEAR